MKISLFTKELEKINTEAFVLGLFEGTKVEDVDRFDKFSDGLLIELFKNKEFNGKFGSILMLRLKGNIKRLIIVGLGKREEFDINKAREAAGKAAVYAKDHNVKEFSMLLFDDLKPYDAAYCIIEGVRLALYQFSGFKTQNKDDLKKIEQFTIVANGSNFIDIDEGIKKSLIVTDAVYYTRDLQNKPSNIVTPSYLAAEAKRISKKFKIRCNILEIKDLKKLNMGGLLAVSSGSVHPPKFVILEYNGGKETICFVGKGITFDSGGISLKPSSDMDEMKFDMSGAAAVLGIMQIASRLKLPYRIIGLVPTTENLPSGNAYKPGDVVKLNNGKTAEIINTDAEGRLILADALAFSKKFNPSCVIDFATLTGACVVSLGDVYSGLFSTDDELANKIIDAGNKTGENVWRLPLHDKYKDYIKSNIADMKNLGPREGGAITAAIFLKEFVDCKKWAHIDIAGTAWTKNSKDVLKPHGGTGIGVRLAIQLLEDWKNSS